MALRQVSLWIFPEGTRSSGPEPGLLPFKKGAFHLAVQGKRKRRRMTGGRASEATRFADYFLRGHCQPVSRSFRSCVRVTIGCLTARREWSAGCSRSRVSSSFPRSWEITECDFDHRFPACVTVLPPIPTDGMSATDVHQLVDTVRDQMLTTLKQISTASPEARVLTSDDDASEEVGESAPLIGRSSGVYGSQDDGVRRRSRGSSARFS